MKRVKQCTVLQNVLYFLQLQPTTLITCGHPSVAVLLAAADDDDHDDDDGQRDAAANEAPLERLGHGGAVALELSVQLGLVASHVRQPELHALQAAAGAGHDLVLAVGADGKVLVPRMDEKREQKKCMLVKFNLSNRGKSWVKLGKK